MKRAIILVLFFVMVAILAGTVYAHGLPDPVYPPDVIPSTTGSYCWVQPTGATLWYPCDSEGAQLANCNHLMELAMKGVDPFVTDPDKAVTLEEALPIKKTWERAKNTCWSDLKNKQEQHYH